MKKKSRKKYNQKLCIDMPKFNDSNYNYNYKEAIVKHKYIPKPINEKIIYINQIKQKSNKYIPGKKVINKLITDNDVLNDITLYRNPKNQVYKNYSSRLVLFLFVTEYSFSEKLNRKIGRVRITDIILVKNRMSYIINNLLMRNRFSFREILSRFNKYELRSLLTSHDLKTFIRKITNDSWDLRKINKVNNNKYVKIRNKVRLLIDSNSVAIMLMCTFSDNIFNFPGGLPKNKNNGFESPIATAIRETSEELNNFPSDKIFTIKYNKKLNYQSSIKFLNNFYKNMSFEKTISNNVATFTNNYPFFISEDTEIYIDSATEYYYNQNFFGLIRQSCFCNYFNISNKTVTIPINNLEINTIIKIPIDNFREKNIDISIDFYDELNTMINTMFTKDNYMISERFHFQQTIGRT